MRFSTGVEPGKGYSSRKRERLLIDHARVVSYSVGSIKGSGRGDEIAGMRKNAVAHRQHIAQPGRMGVL